MTSFLSREQAHRHGLTQSIAAAATNARHDRHRQVVAAAVAEGRVHPSNEAAWVRALDTDPAAEARLAELQTIATEAPGWQV